MYERGKGDREEVKEIEIEKCEALVKVKRRRCVKRRWWLYIVEVMRKGGGGGR